MIAYPRHFFAKFGKTPVIAYSSSFERKHFTIPRTVFSFAGGKKDLRPDQQK